nr:WxL domain-containing protein [Lactiplantibacillus plantarum]
MILRVSSTPRTVSFYRYLVQNQLAPRVNNVQLHVKGGHAAAKNYSGNIVWTLNSTPTA